MSLDGISVLLKYNFTQNFTELLKINQIHALRFPGEMVPPMKEAKELRVHTDKVEGDMLF